MSSCSFSAIEFLLRIAVAMPVRVATFPIGAPVAAGASAGEAAAPGGVGEGEAVGAGAGAGGCAGWVCASLVGLDIAARATGGFSISIGEGIARTFAAPASMKQPTSESANESRRRVTFRSRARREQAKRSALRLRTLAPECQMNANPWPDC